MISREIEPELKRQDLLGRDVLSRSDRKKIQRGLPVPELFMDSASPFDLSVNRLAPEPGQEPPADRPDLVSDRVIAQISDHRAKRLGRNFYGWAVLSVEHAEQEGRMVLATPQKDNPWHADIRLPVEAKENIRIRRRHATRLAANVQWRSRPI